LILQDKLAGTTEEIGIKTTVNIEVKDFGPTLQGIGPK
jgi:hypothetical protein